MSDSLRAKFQLDLVDGMSGPVDGIMALFDRLQQTMERVVRAVNPFEEIGEPIPRAVEEVNRLNETVDRTMRATEGAAGATTELNEALGATGTAARGAVEGLERIGTAAEAGVGRAVSAVERLHGLLGAAGGGHIGGVMGAAGHFHESVERGIGNAFGAAAAGFGLIEPVHAAAEYQNTLTHIGIGLDYNDPAKNAAFVDAYSRRLDALARATGQRGSDLAEAAGFFSREGYRGAQLDAVMPVVAHIATAYNAAPEAVAKSTFALQENLHVSNGALGGALASLALAGKSADLPFEALAPLLPQVAAQAGMLGLTGRSGVDNLASALAVVRKSTGTEGEAVTDARRFLSDIISPHVNHRFNKFGVDLYRIEDHARATGADPMMAVMEIVDRLTRHGQDRRVLGTLFGNQESQGFVQALLAHWDQYREIHARTAGADQAVLDRDYGTGRTSTLIQLTAFEEALAQIERRIGQGFVPALSKMTTGLDHVIAAWDKLDAAFPRLTPRVLEVTAGILGLVAATAAIGAVSGPVVAGAELLVAVLGAIASPVGAVVAGVGLLGVGLYELITHFDQVGDALAAAGVATAHFVEAVPHAVVEMWHGLLSELTHFWQTPKSTGPRVVPLPATADFGAPLVIHLKTDPGVQAKAESRPGIVVRHQPGPGTGRTVGRP